MSTTHKVLRDKTTEKIVLRFTHKTNDRVVYAQSFQSGSKREWDFCNGVKAAHGFKDAGLARAIAKVTHILRSQWDNPEWEHEIVKITTRKVVTRDTDVLFPLHPLETLAKA